MTSIPPIASYPLPASQTLPANKIDWRPDRERSVLLVHDMQNYFVRPFAPDLRSVLIDNIVRLHRTCSGMGVPIAYSAQPGGMTDQERGLLRDFWGPGMQAIPQDRDIIEELVPEPSDWLVKKWRYSALFNNDLLGRIRGSGRDQLVLCGVYANVGVLMTAADAYSHDIQVFVVADAVADFREESHRQALEYASQTCAAVLTTEEAIQCLIW